MARWPSSGASRRSSNTWVTRPMSLDTVIVWPSLTAIPADSWPRCWRAYSPRYVRWATVCPGAYTPKTPQAWPICGSFTGAVSHAPTGQPRPWSSSSEHLGLGAHMWMSTLRCSLEGGRKGVAPGVGGLREVDREGAVGLEAVAAGGPEVLGGEVRGAGPLHQVGRRGGVDGDDDARRRLREPGQRGHQRRPELDSEPGPARDRHLGQRHRQAAIGCVVHAADGAGHHQVAHEVVPRGGGVDIGGGRRAAAQVVHARPLRPAELGLRVAEE